MTASAMTREIKQALLAEYGHFSDARIKKIDSGSEFIVDDRSRKDHDAKGHLYSWFCSIRVTVISATEVRINLGGKVAVGDAVSAWEASTGDRRVFTVGPETVDRLRNLADAHRALVAPGVWVQEMSYKHVCPRTAASLELLAGVLERHWNKDESA